ncbi:MAG: OsmC family protein [Geminicoccaceae bacterium]
MAHHYQARLIWTGAAKGVASVYDGYSREYRIEIDGKPPIRGSSDPIYRGDPALHNPEDLLLASLSACHMLWYLHLCTDAGIHVSAYADDAEGKMDHVGGKIAFTDVLLRPKVTILDGDVEQALALHHDANQACFIANSVNFPVRHEPVADRA